ncbi:N-acetyl-gamma-glutamyl-phosphate reductase [Pseudomonas fluorescens ABAC62]|nr:N-acetyl-gamma-glutamyl-phosphate reductase [Pseudomonas fluorescens ABAC62]
MVKVGIVGGTGYTGVELLRLLAQHPQAEVVVITSRSEAGLAVADMYPNLRGHYDGLAFSVPDVKTLGACDVVFFATPHGVAHALAGELLAAGTKVIDLSADFRLQDADEWAKWYGQPHGAPQLLEEAVYGLPEVNREQIKQARLIAVPGCYPTATQLGFLPLLEAGLADASRLIADCKSGVSGAGRGAAVGSLYSETSESMKAYAVKGHRHLPEIRQGLRRSVVDRSVDLQALFEKRYANEPFVDVMPAGSHPETRSVRGANVCRIAVHRPQDGDLVVVLSVIDNLVKGASGQAVQNMNILFGLDEKSGLSHAGMLP